MNDVEKVDGATDKEFDADTNGEEAYSYLDSWFPDEEYGDIEVDYVCIEFEFTATEPCAHMCHSDGFMGFIWSIVNFFCSIFGINPVCSCGEANY